MFSFFDNISTIGIQNAAVLPVPVCAEPSISLLCKAKGIVCAWTGVGFEKFILARAKFKFSERLRLSKLFINFSYVR